MTRAIRSVLAVSATVLALSGSGVAMAGTWTCASTAPDTMSCNGDFTETVPGTIFLPTVDLTLILGDEAPTSVIPLAGEIGIEASWGGKVGITSYADITTDGADGIHQYGSTSATLSNFGSISTNVTAADANAVDISAYGNVTMVNGGDIFASGNGAYDVTAVTAYSVDGNVSVNNQAAGTITADATDGNAVAVYAYAYDGTVRVNNDGVISASSVNGTATGIYAVANVYGLTPSVINSGSIDATSEYSQAVGVAALGSAGSNAYGTVRNSGSISASGYDLAIGIEASGRGGLLYNYGAVSATADDLAIGIESSVNSFNFVYNAATGSIMASSTYGDATGVSADTFVHSQAGYNRMINAGSISAIAYDQATGIEASAGRTDIKNAGSITAAAYSGTAVGIVAHDYLKTKITNSGSIQATSTLYSAVGVDALGLAYLTTIANSGSISAAGGYSATGVQAYSYNGTVVENSGSLIAHAGTGNAYGVIAEVNGTFADYEYTHVSNSGSILATSDHGHATGIWAISGAITVDNSGAVIVASAYATATGILAQSENIADASVINSGNIEATGYFHNLVQGIGAYAFLGDVYVTNAGSITASTGIAQGAGILAVSQYGSVTVDNSGDISASSAYGIGAPSSFYQRDYANGIFATSDDGTTVINSGNITAVGSWLAIGIEAIAIDGGVQVTNTGSGTITVTGDQNAIGVGTGQRDYAYYSGNGFDNHTDEAVIDNAGNITVAATGNCGDCYRGVTATGIDVFLNYGRNVAVSNSGDLSVSAELSPTRGGWARGINVLTYTGDVAVDNSGSIAVTTNGHTSGAYSTYGIFGSTFGGDVSVTNSGDINVSSWVSQGVHAESDDMAGSVVVSNSGDISVYGNVRARGIYAGDSGRNFQSHPFGYGEVVVDNSGSIQVTAGTNEAFGIQARFAYGDAGITNSGDITAASKWVAAGVFARSSYYLRQPSRVSTGDVSFDNSGSISASVAGGGVPDQTLDRLHAWGVQLINYDGDSHVSNSGAITAALYSDAKSLTEVGVAGVNVISFSKKEGMGNIDITNAGDITATIRSDNLVNGYATFRVGAAARGIGTFSSVGNVAVVNSGSITASARSDQSADGGVTASHGISVISYGGLGNVYAHLGDITVSNEAGSIAASAFSYGEGDASATGIYSAVRILGAFWYVLSDGDGITVDNAGSVSALAVIGDGGTGVASANGIFAVNESTDGFVNVSNTGSVLASATATYAVTAAGVFASGRKNVSITLGEGSNVQAIATGASGKAIGLSVSGNVITASNAGAISAEFIGGGDTYGALIASLTGDVTFTNSGAITATDADYAVGVQLNSLTATTLINSGTITATSVLTGSIAVRTGASADSITNTGTINGVIVTGDGDDTLNNSVGGIWNAVGSSDFGAGDDGIANAGTIFMSNATITLGSHAAGGNVFTNTGMIRVSGDSNTIDLGALNPKPFTNTGTISFMDGAPDDMLTIAGDFGGNGHINLDVSGLHGTSDLLYINGDVVNGSVTTIDARVLDVPTTATGSVALVKVAGDSSTGSFVLGNVTFDTTRSFLTVQGVSVNSVIDTSNARPDVFSMDFAVTGLTDTGTLAAAFAPGVQSLMNSQVGTWRQRMGVIDKTTSGPSVWARAFQDDGTVDPTHQANNFGQGGSFAFDQRNAGQEVGVDFGFSDQFSVGLLLGKAQARQHLTDSATTTSKLDGTTSGVYGTWISPSGFYADASYRHMSFDVTLHSAAGETRTHGKANAFNLEAGYAWTLGDGFKLEPQLQYTRTTVGDVDTLTGALAGFTPDGGASSRGRLGVAVRKSFGAGKTVWTPYATVSAVRESDGKNAYAINGNFSGSTSTEGSSALVEGGLNVKTGNLTVFGGVNWQDGGALKSVVGGQLGVRYSW